VFALLLPMLSEQQVRETTGHANMSALTMAVRRGDVVMARALLDHGALASGNGKESVSPLPMAVSVPLPTHARTHAHQTRVIVAAGLHCW
jgi:hypothetical protein